jgi:hypothetical protein
VNGVPASVTLLTTPLITTTTTQLNLGLFAQEQWTIRHLTLNGGVRFDYFNTYIPAQHENATQYAAVKDFPEFKDLPNWKDVSPRFGAAYDIFGNGKTAIKWSMGRYLEALGTGSIADAVNPILAPSSSNTSRSWRDVNGNFLPDCDLTNPAANGECGPDTNANFGKNLVTTRYAPDTVVGFGHRQYNWETMAAVQHEIIPGLSAEASYHRRWFGNFRITQNVLVSPSDFDPFCVTTPVDARLPGGGGQSICGLYAVSTAKFGQNDNAITLANRVGNQTEIYDGVDLTMNARLPGRVTLQGGLNTGRLKQNFCDVALPNASGIVGNPYPAGTVIPLGSATTAFCDIRPPFQTQVKLLGVYQLPWWGIQTSATYQGLPGPQITASWAAPNALIAPSLGRNLPGGAATATIPTVPAGTLYGDRLHQIDARIAKNFRVAGVRVQGQADVYNLANASPVLSLNNTFGAAWQRPIQILPGRIAKFGVQLEF